VGWGGVFTCAIAEEPRLTQTQNRQALMDRIARIDSVQSQTCKDKAPGSASSTVSLSRVDAPIAVLVQRSLRRKLARQPGVDGAACDPRQPG
jgi:hypothetical protein